MFCLFIFINTLTLILCLHIYIYLIQNKSQWYNKRRVQVTSGLLLSGVHDEGRVTSNDLGVLSLDERVLDTCNIDSLLVM